MSVSKENLGTFDCVTFAAAIYSTEIEDRDDDGLLDRWEETAARCSIQPTGRSSWLPMPRRPSAQWERMRMCQDVFVRDRLHADGRAGRRSRSRTTHMAACRSRRTHICRARMR